MKFKAYTGITWSVLELTGLIEDEDSCVYFEKFKKHVGLHPFHLTNLNTALNEILSSNLNSYDPDLKGFLLAYKNPKLLTPLGEIFYDTCFIHVDTEADFYIFRPEVGCTLKGIVNKKGLDHIGILVHKAFNVSIPKPDDEENWPGDNLEIGQEARFVITLLDFSSKLPFIRGVLNADDYLRGCRLMPNSNSNKRLPSENTIQNNNQVLEKDVKHTKNHTFFATDSENTTDEDVAKVKKESVQWKKSEKKLKHEESITYSEKKKKDKKHDKEFKEINESKPKSIKVETVHDHYTNNLSLNSKLMENEELESINLKSKVKKKSRVQHSQSWINEDDDEKPAQHLPSEISNKSILESKDDIMKIKVEHNVVIGSDIEIIPENKPKLERKSMKRKSLDDNDTSLADLNADKCIVSSRSINKRSSKKIKLEESNDKYTHEVSDDAQDSPKKQFKKHRDSLKLETSESDQVSMKRSNILDSEVVFQNIKIKKEKIISESENTQDEDFVEINKMSEKDPDLNTFSSTYDVEEDKNNAIKKKRRKHSKKVIIDTSTIKVEPEFEDVIKIEHGFEETAIKVENSNNNDDINEDVYSEQDVKATTSSPRKKHSVNLSDDNNRSNIKRSKKKEVDEEIHSGKVKTEKFVVIDGSDIDNNDANLQNTEKKKKHSKRSLHKQLNKSREFESGNESEFDFRNVKIKTERFSDS
ncbi:transcriptional regulator ATRX homolog isoform X2 [Bombus flavifrons]|uniref:transcriptional regulator ATRX homolog isoform X2 n=1 Tax=Bombus flavifrons TaxID=103934 RepID=UPI0037046F3F